MAVPTLTLAAPFPFWTCQCRSGTTYTANSLGVISALSSDCNDLEAGGCTYAILRHNVYNTPGAPAAANSTITVASATLTAGTLTIGAQPDVIRPLAVIAQTQSGSTLTAGLVTMTYTANDSTTQVDALNLAASGPLAGTLTLSTSKGVERLTSAIVSGVVGGGLATIWIGTSATLAVPLEPGFSSWSITKEIKITPTNGTFGLMVPSDETISTLTTSNGLVALTTAPDGTHQMSVGYVYTMPATYPA